ncbi:MAG: prepilin peptidase [Eubacteriales bacterium]|nr:prepilin peptidase [Eubacteriales bacterium]
MADGLMVVFLGICSIQDVRRREISRRILAVGSVAAVLMQVCTRKLEYWDFALGIAVGLALLGIAFATREALGYGDGLAVLAMGMFAGGCRALEILLLAFGMAALVSGGCLALKKAKRNDSLPFLPFLTAAAVICMALEGG